MPRPVKAGIVYILSKLPACGNCASEASLITSSREKDQRRHHVRASITALRALLIVTQNHGTPLLIPHSASQKKRRRRPRSPNRTRLADPTSTNMSSGIVHFSTIRCPSGHPKPVVARVFLAHLQSVALVWIVRYTCCGVCSVWHTIQLTTGN